MLRPCWRCWFYSSGLVFAQESGEKTFATPQEAGKALYDAAKAADKDAIVAVLGATSGSVVSSGDEVQDKNTRD